MIFGRNKKPDDAATETPVAPAPTAPAPAPVAAPAPVIPAQPAPIAAAPAAPSTAQPIPAAVAAPAQPAPAAAAPQGGGEPSPEVDPEQQARRAMGAKMMAASFGEIITVLMHSNIYKHFSLSDLDWLVIPPVLTQQFVLAEVRKGEGGIPAPVGVALWASVSPEVDEKLSANTTGPLRLRPDEWKSGDILWLIDAVGPPQVIDGLVQNLHKSVFKGRPVKVRSRDEDGKPVIKVQQLPATDEAPTAT